ncbi:MAG TPA: AbgT family transporter, partial [Kribbella sp.]|nr:AbgT family transporter [Kribbella sp.]
MNAKTVDERPGKPGAMQRILNGIERVGNKVPHPALIFLALIVLVIVLSQILSWAGTSVTTEVAEPATVQVAPEYPQGTSVAGNDAPPAPAIPKYEVKQETITAESLLDGDGIRFIFTTAVQNFNDFGVVAVILVAMIGVGVAEEAGLIAALIRKMVKVAPKALITFIIVLLGGISSVASDAGYLVLIPLGAAAFASLGRHPLAGIAAAYAGVSAAFFVNVLITPADG